MPPIGHDPQDTAATTAADEQAKVNAQNQAEKKSPEDEKLSRHLGKVMEKMVQSNLVQRLHTSIGRFLKFLGVEFTLAAIVRQSQVLTSFISNIFRLLGVVADTLLIPFLPLLGIIAKFITTELVPFIRNQIQPLLEDAATAIGNVLQFLFDVVKPIGTVAIGILAALGILTGVVGAGSDSATKNTTLLGNIILGVGQTLVLALIAQKLMQKVIGLFMPAQTSAIEAVKANTTTANTLLQSIDKNIAIQSSRKSSDVVLGGGRAAGAAGLLFGWKGLILTLVTSLVIGLITGFISQIGDAVSGANASREARGLPVGGSSLGYYGEVAVRVFNTGDGVRATQINDQLVQEGETAFAGVTNVGNQ